MNIFEINEQVQETVKGGYLSAGINENVSLIKVAFEENKENSDNYGIRFYFQNESGDVFNHFEFQPDASREDFAAKTKSLISRLKHIATKFMPEEKVLVSGATVEEGMKKYVDLFTNIDLTNVKVRIKLVLNDRDYTKFTPYLPFIEAMTVNPTRLTIGNKERIDKKPRPVVEEFGSTPTTVEDWD